MKKFLLYILVLLFIAGCATDRRVRTKPTLKVDRNSSEYKELLKQMIHTAWWQEQNKTH